MRRRARSRLEYAAAPAWAALSKAVNPLAFPHPHGPSLTVEMQPAALRRLRDRRLVTSIHRSGAPGYGTHAAAGGGLALNEVCRALTSVCPAAGPAANFAAPKRWKALRW